MRQTITLCGLDRLSSPKAGPAGRLRPLFQLSQDKARWLPLEHDFPNSGLISWWQPTSDALPHSVWQCQIEVSPTYDPDNVNHDYYRVKGIPLPAIELVELANADDPESIRHVLVEEGIAPLLFATRRVVIRDRSGLMIGPIDLILHDSRLFLSDSRRDIPIPLTGQLIETALASWEGRRFLPVDGWGRKVGEVDFSPDGVFLKRVLRDLRNIAPNISANAKLTEKLISEYCASIEATSLTPVQHQRMQRLRRIAQQSQEDVKIAEDGVAELLSMQVVREVIAKAEKTAAEKAAEAMRASLKQLNEKRSQIKVEINTLDAVLSLRKEEVKSLDKRNAATISTFNTQVQQKFQEVAQDASSFLAEIALIQAALQRPDAKIKLSASTGYESGIHVLKAIPAASMSALLRDQYANAGLSVRTADAVLASLASGLVPVVHGEMGNECLRIVADCIFGGRIFWIAIHSSVCAPTDLLKLPATSRFASIPFEQLLKDLGQQSELSLVVLENLNLSQIDSAIVPLLRRYSDQKVVSQSATSQWYPTPVGAWPSNLLLSGLLIESPLSLPLSREMWSHSTLIDAVRTSVVTATKGIADDSSSHPSTFVPSAEWVQWWNEASNSGISDSRILTTFIQRKNQMNSTYRGLLNRLAAFVDFIEAGSDAAKDACLLAETALIPYLIARGIDVHGALEGAPVEIPGERDIVSNLKTHFAKWGIGAGGNV
jgi:hypothetical protein